MSTGINDEKDFRSLYELYAPRVYSLALHFLKSRDAAQDILQEIFIKLWNRREELPGIENFDAWLGTVVKNQVIDQLRKDKRFKDQAEEEDDSDPEKKIISKQTAFVIRAAIEKLPGRQKQVYQLARDQGYTHSEIAEQLGLSIETVKAHMKQALKNLRESLKNIRED